MKNFRFDAVVLSWSLITLIALILLGAGVGSWQLQKILASERKLADHAKIDATISVDELRKAQNLQVYLETHKADVEKAATVVAETKTYQYQNQIVEDVNRYAAVAGVTVLGFNFPAQGTTAAPAGKTSIKTLQATVTLQNPVPYTNYLRFLKLIEQNLTKMQITDISITPDTKIVGQINNPTIGLQVYVR